MNRKTIAGIFSLMVVLLCSMQVWADDHAKMEEKPSLSASRTVTMSATVEAINHETREVTLRGPEGETTEFTASEDVRNLAQVEVGDTVIAEVFEEISIEVVANPEGLAAGAGEVTAAAAAELGELPGAAIMDSIVITAIVEEINLEANTFKLRGPEGNVREFAARNPENLTRAEVGDMVVITITQAMGIMVETP